IGGVLLALPFAIIFTLLLKGGDPPPFGPLEPLLNTEARPNVVGSAIVVGTWLLALIAFIVNTASLVRGARAGQSIATRPANLVVAIVTFAFAVFFVGAIVV